MASKRRLRRQACGSKRRFSDQSAAEDCARKISGRQMLPVHAYACPHCGGFHVGHPMTQHRRKRRAEFVRDGR